MRFFCVGALISLGGQGGPRKFRQRACIPLLSLFWVIMVLACNPVPPTDRVPSSRIISPRNGSAFSEGDEIEVQSVSSDPQGIWRVELVVDGKVVHTDSPVTFTTKFEIAQTWRATVGNHTVGVRAYNLVNGAIDPAVIALQVTRSTPTSSSITPTRLVTNTIVGASDRDSSTPTLASDACTNNAAYVADVTIPDGSVIPTGAGGVKTWRVRNTGTCTWGVGYQFVFVSGEAMSSATAIPVPNTLPRGTADLSVSLTAPGNPGSHKGGWRMKSPDGVLFGQLFTVVITVVAPGGTTTRQACSGTPEIESFSADATRIAPGGSTSLRWGWVTNASEVEIDQGIGGITAGPNGGSIPVSPATTTTYTLTAYCGPYNSVTRQVTITVVFKVTGVSGSVSPTSTNGGATCTATFNFSFVVTVEGAATVNWLRDRSDGDIKSGSLTFSAAGSQTVNEGWTVTGKPGANMFGMRLRVTSPNEGATNPIVATLNCP